MKLISTITRLGCLPKELLSDFSTKLQTNLKKRFEKRNGSVFRKYVNELKSNFPETRLSFRLGQLFFNERRYWEAHEAWEVFWHEERDGDYKKFLQGLIQLASALFKLTEKTNFNGALSLFKKSLEKLKKNRYQDKYITLVDSQMPLESYILANIQNLETILANQTAEGNKPAKKAYTPYTLVQKSDHAFFF